MAYGDFSLNPFQYRERVSRVLYQMGRVQLDSDFNEQTETSLHFLRGLGIDVIGRHGALEGGFKIGRGPTPDVPFSVGYGVYYVDGIRVMHAPFEHPWEILGASPQETQSRVEAYRKGLPARKDDRPFWNLDFEAKNQLLYLAVWERNITSSEYDEMREVALLGPDTTTRTLITWQIRGIPLEQFDTAVKDFAGLFDATDPDATKYDVNYVALNYLLRSGALLKAKAKENQEMEACLISPEARFRGMENRLYRVEIHSTNPKTFKWSPDNGAVVYPIRDVKGTTVILDSLGRDERTAIRKNDWVEVMDETTALRTRADGKNNALRQVVDINRQRMTIELDEEPENNAGTGEGAILRRWADDAQPFAEGQWIELSDGVQVNFSHVDRPKGGFRTGDYWLIPARTATGDVIWPGTKNDPAAVPPHGVDVHYAPLARVTMGATAAAIVDLRRRFQQLAIPV